GGRPVPARLPPDARQRRSAARLRAARRRSAVHRPLPPPCRGQRVGDGL
ncbi:MAG: hypothetical protein AVDCRST_MAG39-2620, partial [uncultured Sphingomonadaceae bacterium]